jgi:hypothetical protein
MIVWRGGSGKSRKPSIAGRLRALSRRAAKEGYEPVLSRAATATERSWPAAPQRPQAPRLRRMGRCQHQRVACPSPAACGASASALVRQRGRILPDIMSPPGTWCGVLGRAARSAAGKPGTAGRAGRIRCFAQGVDRLRSAGRLGWDPSMSIFCMFSRPDVRIPRVKAHQKGRPAQQSLSLSSQ